VKRFGKYRRKLWKDLKNMDNMEEKYFFLENN
jgi:rRNA maturation protein Nop10